MINFPPPDRLTQGPVGEVPEKLQVARNGEDVEEVEEDVHGQDEGQVGHGLHVDVPHLPRLPARVRLIGLQGAAHAKLLCQTLTGQLAFGNLVAFAGLSLCLKLSP